MSLIAVIDVGSNSLKVAVFDQQQREIARATEAVRIFPQQSGPLVITPEVMTSAVQAIQRLVDFARGKGAERIYILGTSAVRDCQNRKEFDAAIQNATGLKLIVISGEVESRLVGKAVRQDPAYREYHNLLAFDLGGGSLEVVRMQGDYCTFAQSFPLGAVRLTQEFFADSKRKMSEGTQATIRNYIQSVLGPVIPRTLAENFLMVGAGGVFSVVALYLEAVGEPPVGGRLSILRIRELKDKMCGMTLEERKQVPGVPADRADIMPVALITVCVLADLTGAEAFYLTHRGIRHGMVDLILGPSGNLI
jgi:exopolyphosphatase/guanosine-5'-triphosphate,3'-diphosphate pyrophosphatase